MINYYEILGLNPEMPLDDIKTRLKQLQQKWQLRTNAPNLKKRQESEEMLKIITEAKTIFLTQNDKKKYDISLNQIRQRKNNNPSQHLDFEQAKADYDRAIALINKENAYTEASLILKRLILDFPKNSVFHMGYGYCLNGLGRKEEAVDAYDTAIAYDAKNSNAYYHLIELLLLDNDKALAKQYLNVALRNCDDKYKFIAHRIFFYRVEKNYDEIIQLIESARRDDFPLNDYLKGQLSSAYFNKAIGLYTRDSYGDVYFVNEDNIDEALEILEKAMEFEAFLEGQDKPSEQHEIISNILNKEFHESTKKLFVFPSIFAALILFLYDGYGRIFFNRYIVGMCLVALGGLTIGLKLAKVSAIEKNKAFLKGEKLAIEKFIIFFNWVSIGTLIWVIYAFSPYLPYLF